MIRNDQLKNMLDRPELSRDAFDETWLNQKRLEDKQDIILLDGAWAHHFFYNPFDKTRSL